MFLVKFNQPLDNALNCLINLKILAFGDEFNQELTNLPKNIFGLMLGEKFNKEIPFEIKSLSLHSNINIINNLPDCIESFELYNKYELINLSNSIKKLILKCPSINHVILPKATTYLKIYSSKLNVIKNISPNLEIEYFNYLKEVY